jgi:hypothetical protein
VSPETRWRMLRRKKKNDMNDMISFISASFVFWWLVIKLVDRILGVFGWKKKLEASVLTWACLKNCGNEVNVKDSRLLSIDF